MHAEEGSMSTPNPAAQFSIAIIQHAPVFLNLEASLDKACSLAEQAANQDANVIVFPETWLPGYPVWLDYAPTAALWDYAPAKALYRLLVENSIAIPGPHLTRLLDLARRTGAYVVMGAHERLGGTLYNTMILLHRDGQTFHLHRKLMPTYTERLIWGRGDGSTLTVLPTEYGTLGGLICWEHWMPLARAAMHARGEVLHVAQWPMVKELHHLASRHYAFEGQCFVVAAGCTLSRSDILAGVGSLGQPDSKALDLLSAIPGDDHDLLLRGGSAVIGPDSHYITGPVLDESCTLYAGIQPQRISEGHLALDTQGHYARPDVFHLQVNDEPQVNVAFTSQSNESW
jgi:predicted amidohydrolase